jgi:RND family efflux transporter MFP subunit
MKQILPAVFSIAFLLMATACSKPAEPPVPEPVARVVTVKAQRGDLPISVTGYGTVEFDPALQRVLTTEIEARVTDILVQPGSRVDRGADLIRLTPSSASGLGLSKARADADAAQAELARQKRLRADGLASDADVERAQNTANDLAAQAETLIRTAGAISNVGAPDSGIVDAILVSVGDVLPAGSGLIRLSEPDAIQARINLELEDATRLTTGGQVHIEGLDGGTHIADALIAAVDLRIDPQTRMASIRVPIPPGVGFLPGEAIRATAAAEIRRNIILAPRKAIFSDEQGDYVFVDDGGTAARRRVESGATSGQLTEIISGLAEGDLIVTEGAAILSDGMKLDTSADVTSTQAQTGDSK